MKKRIILCCDGTWNDLEMRYITNVGRIAQAVLPVSSSGMPQIVYYDDGVGADKKGLARMISGGFGIGLERNIYEAYRFLCFNYEKGDEVMLYGFSRGAYTIRSLAGMIGKVGLVKSIELKHIPEALELYRNHDDSASESFKRKFARNVSITLMGCWDTVGALGIPDKTPLIPFDDFRKSRYEFHDTNLGIHIERALHAVSIDERRKEFLPTLMNQGPSVPSSQKLKQIWFPGNHGSVGGGSWDKRGLSNGTLNWMVGETVALLPDVAIDLNRLKDKANADHSIYFNQKVEFVYSEIDRDVEAKWSEIHETARLRWKENGDYRPAKLKKKFGTQLNKWKSAKARRLLAKARSLEVGGEAFAKVQSESKLNRSKVLVTKGEVYRIEISDLQVWKDGNLDACDIRGWDTTGKKGAWKKGKPYTFDGIKKRLINTAKKNRLNIKGDWFELVASVDGKKFDRLKFSVDKKKTRFVAEYKAPKKGELVFAANDLSSSWKLIDKYDNNEGWAWIRIERKQ